VIPALIQFTPDPIAIHIGPLPLAWYGITYAVGLLACYQLLVRQAARFGQNPALVGNGIVVVAIAALIGGRLYHVIDQWPRYQDDLLAIVLPPYAGLGVYGGLISGTIAAVLLTRFYRVPFPVWADIIAPALFLMQAIGRWGNFFNQELYGPPTSLPWGIAIDCAHRIVAYPCEAFPETTTGFQPLFLYESISGFLGLAVLLWLERRHRPRFRPGDMLLIFFMWYGAVRFGLEFLRQENWTIGGIATAQIFSTVFALGALAIFVGRRLLRPGPPPGPPPDATDIEATKDAPEEEAAEDMVSEGGPV
jgi:phosphatidylglycerol:prolipoprotein diacylglycerol transferase